MKIEERLALEYYAKIEHEMKRMILGAYMKGYGDGCMRGREIILNGIKFYDLGLPSGTLWSAPIRTNPETNCKTYEILPYRHVCNLDLPSLEDLKELIDNCMIMKGDLWDIVILGPSGEKINIGTNNYTSYGTDNDQQGEGIAKEQNKFWIKSDINQNYATVGLVDLEHESLSCSQHYIGYRLPYMLIMKP